jgi:hypothetical protein
MASIFDGANFETVFNKLATSVKTELDLQFTERRIIGSEYANAYTQLMDTVLKLAYGDQANQSAIDYQSEQKADIVAKRQPSIDLMNAQKEVYLRQKTGFDDNAKQKMLETQLNSWGLMFSSGMLETAPGIITNDKVSALYQDMATHLGVV